MAKCGITECTNSAVAGFERADANLSVIRWCKYHEVDLADEVYGPGRHLNQRQVDKT
jgi:hypothetical protein